MPEAYKPVYRAKQRLRAKLPNGTYKTFEVGEPIPGAENWPNPALWAKPERQYIERIDGLPVDPSQHGPYVPPRAMTNKDFEAALERKKKRLAGEAMQESAWPKGQLVGAGENKVPAIVDPGEGEIDERAPEAPVNAQTLAELEALSRGELFKLAKEHNLKVNGSETKADLAASLMRG